ncbi:hypothetical protein HL658_33985 [Azospirillum sp. RWY-5-1]|uniref:HAMP domain-containing protein n=1 Tax=Azospirillum oleiclasticum TaxID=2735135 RepID=A0ABX2TML1_9PROT|nr:hypothetical protein [Azospirillum oleiclasticum]NYZ17581.1 hypothetical protein [Azospirillum oleiclasticum]NYZ24951.1 hypothetical protein [Azospirillum oleiclasticum]
MVKGGALALRAGIVIAATVGAAVAMTVALAYLKFERKLIDVTISRLSVVAEEVRRKSEYGLTLGLDLAEMADLQGVVERAAEGSAEIESVAVVADDGAVVFSSDRAELGSAAALPWGEPTASSGPMQHAVAGARVTVGAIVRNSFGQTVGQVVLRSSLAALRAEMDAVRGDLTRKIGRMVAAAGLLTILAVFVTIRLSMRGRSGGIGDATADTLHRTVEPRIAAATAKAEHELAALGRDLDELDRRFPAAAPVGIRPQRGLT